MSNGTPRFGVDVGQAKTLVAELCRHFYDQGWVSGTGGGISIRADPDQIVMAPSGVQKERMQEDDMFVLAADGAVLETPTAKPYPQKPPKLSECSPLFMAAYELRGAGAVLHSHAPETVMATLLAGSASEFRCTQLEMIKGIKGHGFYDTLVVPIIENTARECQLTDRLRAAIEEYPSTYAVLVRRHGVYVWGDNWIQAKTHAECYHYLFQIATRMTSMKIDPAFPALVPPPEELEGHVEPPAKRAKTAGDGVNGNGHAASPKAKVVLLDIEGTTTPISFVAETLFPLALSRFGSFLGDRWGDAKVRAAAQALYEACKAANQEGAFVEAPPKDAGAAQVAAFAKALFPQVEEWTRENLKVPAWKTVQGLIWDECYAEGTLKAPVYDDVPLAMAAWIKARQRVCIYSSGTRQAQRLLFQHSSRGDLRPYISAYFDLTSGSKRSRESYAEIALSLGVDPQDVHFVTDVFEEAEAATAAGMTVTISVREGNKPLPADHGFSTSSSFTDIV